MLFDRQVLKEMRLVGDERERALGANGVALHVVAGDRHVAG
jgi:hypothetical protein